MTFTVSVMRARVALWWLAWRLGGAALLVPMALARRGHGLLVWAARAVDNAEVALVLAQARLQVMQVHLRVVGRRGRWWRGRPGEAAAQARCESPRACPRRGVCMHRADCADAHCPGRGR